MKIEDLQIFNEMPFLFWIKNRDGKYLWGNRAIANLAGEDVRGKTDAELAWSENAEELKADDLQVFQTGKPKYFHESVDKSNQGKAMLNVCKWLGDFEGTEQCFGISFTID